jgi:hypothetical protein
MTDWVRSFFVTFEALRASIRVPKGAYDETPRKRGAPPAGGAPPRFDASPAKRPA